MTAPRTTPVRPLLALLACAISATAIPMVTGFNQTRRIAEVVVGGEAARWRVTVSDALRAAPPPPTPELLARIVATNRARGLRTVALLPPNGDVIASGPVPTQLIKACQHVPRESVTIVGDRVIACAGPLMPRGERESMPPPDSLGGPWRGPPPFMGGPPPPIGGPPIGGLPPFDGRPPPPQMAGPRPVLAYEFDALAARDLSHAHTNLLASGAVALAAMLALGLVALRLLKDRESIAQSLAQSRHLSSLGEMSAVLAHEIRNPLASLKGHAQLLAERLEGDARLSLRAGRVVSDAERLERLVDELLTFARTGKLDLREVRPEAWVRGVVEAVDARIDVETERAPARWRLDSSRLGEALSNVLRNALDADGQGRVSVRVTTERSELVIEVRDHGAGITPGEEERIFEPFHTGKVRGTGLGLAIARRAAALHGGTLTAQNHRDGGALFRFALPDG